MNKLEMKGVWNIAKGKLKQRLGRMTYNDRRFAEGQKDEFVGRIQKRTGRTKAEVDRLIREGC